MTKKIFDNIQTLEDLEKLGLPFEEAYKQLEEIISLQESGNITLEDNIKYYKLGKHLIKYCQNILDKAQLEIEKI